MAIVITDMKGGQRPERSACGWSTADVRNWRFTNGVAFQRLLLRGFDTSGGRGPIYGVTGGWWSGILTDGRFGTCGSSDPLVSWAFGANSYIYLDIWKALAQGLWTSSMAIGLVPVAYDASATSSTGLWAGPETSAVPTTMGPRYASAAYPGSCGNRATYTVTIRDDGTFTVT